MFLLKQLSMKPSTELFKLIKSLTKSEKRFFKLTSSLQSGEKNYLKIFDFIEKQAAYNEEELKEEFKDEIFIKHLPSEKNHLYKLVLKSLRSFYSEQSVSSILKQEMKNVEILYNKALYKECEKFVGRAKEIAKGSEKFYYWYELISWEKKLLEEAYESGEFSNNLDELVEEEEMVISKLRNLAEYQVLYSKINLIFRSGGFTRNEGEQKAVEEIADYHLIKGKNTALSTRAASMCYYIKGLCAATNRNFKDSFEFFNKTREILDNNPNIKLDSAQRYVLTLSHLLRCYIDSKDFKSAQDLIADIRALEGKKGFNSIDIRVRLFTNSYNQELVLLHTMGEFNACIELIGKIEELQEHYGEKVNKEQEILLTYNKAYSYFGVGEYKKALSYLNNVLNDNEQNLRQDIYSFARLFNLVLHFELENYDFLEYVIKSTNRYLNKQERDFEVETVCIKHIRKLAKAMNQNERNVILNQLKAELDVLLRNHHERVVLEYFNITAWIEAKLQKKEFAVIVQDELSIRV
jgi:tetratricopeptide (TPR) repeat protein